MTMYFQVDTIVDILFYVARKKATNFIVTISSQQNSLLFTQL